ncbi:hypothetical protein CC80DRAFT_503676 [Byssothecium circinans]|uniref:Uncharacterized protein n=1 Tax=Byssothecium circinans TaxID=147558 RepID=A0A6A5U2U8_9PLEO|nr:hypothetical protein CC80DRAFT_503676 [Byssothecium circinans]
MQATEGLLDPKKAGLPQPSLEESRNQCLRTLRAIEHEKENLTKELERLDAEEREVDDQIKKLYLKRQDIKDQKAAMKWHRESILESFDERAVHEYEAQRVRQLCSKVHETLPKELRDMIYNYLCPEEPPIPTLRNTASSNTASQPFTDMTSTGADFLREYLEIHWSRHTVFLTSHDYEAQLSRITKQLELLSLAPAKIIRKIHLVVFSTPTTQLPDFSALDALLRSFERLNFLHLAFKMPCSPLLHRKDWALSDLRPHVHKLWHLKQMGFRVECSSVVCWGRSRPALESTAMDAETWFEDFVGWYETSVTNHGC